MQRHYTSAKYGASIPEDDGRSLLAIDQYRVVVRESRQVTDLIEERDLVARARYGDSEAESRLIESCQHTVYGTAWYYMRLHPSNSDVLDLVQAGNEAIVRHLAESFKSRYPIAFLCAVARHAMRHYCIEDKTIRVPNSSYCRGRRAPLTVSLTAPLYGDDGRSLLDCLEDADWQGIKAGMEVAHV